MIRSSICSVALLLIGCGESNPSADATREREQAVSTTPVLEANSPFAQIEPEPSQPTTGQVATEVPSQFRGTWSSLPGHCDQAGDSLLQIEADRVDFYESRGKVLAVRILSPREIEIDLLSTGEGETSTDTRTFEISEDGQGLTNIITGNYAQRVERTRCTVS